MPGDSTTITAELITPIAMEKELRFVIAKAATPSAPALSPRFLINQGVPDARIFHLNARNANAGNYTSRKNKKLHPERLELSKFCYACRKHTAHKERK